MALQGLFDEIFLCLSGDVVEDCLYGVSTLLMAADLDEVFLDQLEDTESLLNTAVR